MMSKTNRREFLKTVLGASAMLTAGARPAPFRGGESAQSFDLLIKGGLLYDGSGAGAREADIAIQGDRIQKIADHLNPEGAGEVIDARGMAVSPGFIDAHSHTAVELLANPLAESQIRQGVTTEISGNCGSSPFPVSDTMFPIMKKNLKEEYDILLDWRDIGGFFKRLKLRGMAPNHATLLGHGTVRGAVVGYNDRPPSEAQIQAMREMTERNMRSGALGLSSGLEYAPGSYAQTEELVALCRMVARLNGVYATHMRSEGDHLIESIEESLGIARSTGVSLQISHLKVAFPANWHKIDKMLSLLEAAKAKGIDVLADRYPYTAGSTGLSFFFPLWARQGTPQEFLRRLQDPGLDKKIRAHVKEQELKLGSWRKVILSSVVSQKNKKWQGKTIQQAAVEAGKSPYGFMRDILIEEENRAQMVLFMADERNLKRILSHPLVVIGADGVATAPYGILGQGKPHPRLYGTFPRVLGKYAREEKLFSMAEAVRKMTSFTAKKFGLHQRGLLREGYFADVVVFNPNTVRDRATWGDPHKYPVGIRDVLVNGQPVLRDGAHTGRLPGRILTGRKKWTKN